MKTLHTLTIEITCEDLELLSALGEPKEVVTQLIHSAVEGIRRPGAWERNWLIQAFGPEFENNLEVDPKCEWHQRPQKVAKEGT